MRAIVSSIRPSGRPSCLKDRVGQFRRTSSRLRVVGGRARLHVNKRSRLQIDGKSHYHHAPVQRHNLDLLLVCRRRRRRRRWTLILSLRWLLEWPSNVGLLIQVFLFVGHRKVSFESGIRIESDQIRSDQIELNQTII